MMHKRLLKKLGAGLLLAAHLASPATAETVTYLHTDLLGSVVLETDQNRNVVARYKYEPYGLPRQAIADAPGYTGHVHDAGSGLVYMQQRYYDPEVGRFLSVDPVGVDLATGANFNRYWYGDNNPYTFVDPDGRNAVAGIGGILTETGNLLSGRGFDWDSVIGAFADGYNGEGSGPLAAAFEDATTLGGGAALGAATKVAAGLVKVGKALDAAGDVAGAAKAGRGAVNVTSGGRSVDEALTTGQRFVGEGAQEVGPGVFRSADGTRQFRMTDADITGSHGKIGPHVHFEKFDPVTGEKIKNVHTPLKDQ